jgi:hypothetical protein
MRFQFYNNHPPLLAIVSAAAVATTTVASSIYLVMTTEEKMFSHLILLVQCLEHKMRSIPILVDGELNTITAQL